MSANERAWVRLPSGKHMNLLDPNPDEWEDADLIIGLSRTYRWGGHSGNHDFPLSVAQHCLLVLAVREQMSLKPLSPHDALRELLHDHDEGALSFDCISPLKPFLGDAFRTLTEKLQTAIFKRYDIRYWNPNEYALHKIADIRAAASEAVHVVGWSEAEVKDVLQIKELPLLKDPLAAIYGCEPWKPWPPNVARDRFMAKFNELRHVISMSQRCSEVSPSANQQLGRLRA